MGETSQVTVSQVFDKVKLVLPLVQTAFHGSTIHISDIEMR